MLQVAMPWSFSTVSAVIGCYSITNTYVFTDLQVKVVCNQPWAPSLDNTRILKVCSQDMMPWQARGHLMPMEEVKGSQNKQTGKDLTPQHDGT